MHKLHELQTDVLARIIAAPEKRANQTEIPALFKADSVILGVSARKWQLIPVTFTEGTEFGLNTLKGGAMALALL